MTLPDAVEPISVGFLHSYCRLSTTGEEELLGLLITAAREKAEQYCGRHFISQEVVESFPIDRPCPIPATDILEVSGFYTTPEQAADAYHRYVEYLKGTSISRELPIDRENLPTYAVRYRVTVAPADVPAGVKVAIAKIAADLYENRENEGSPELGISYKVLLAPYRKYA